MKCSLRLSVCVSLLFFAIFLQVPITHSQARTDIDNVGLMPSWTQAGNYVADYQGRTTDLGITYDNLADDPNVRVNGCIILSDPAHTIGEDFTDTHYANIVSGNKHCTPTATAIWMEWYRLTRCPWLKNLGGEDAAIRAFAEYQNTNDQNLGMPGHSNTEAHFGTFREEMISGVNAYLRDSSWLRTRLLLYHVVKWRWDWNAYTKLIRKSNPPIIWNVNSPGSTSLHTVVGIGYDEAGNVWYIDPDDGMPHSKPKTEIAPEPPEGTENRQYGSGSSESEQWYNTVLLWLDVTPIPVAFERFGPRVNDIVFEVFGTQQAEFTGLETGQIDVVDSPLTQYYIDRWSQDPNIQIDWYDENLAKAHRKYYGTFTGEEEYAGQPWLGFVNQSGFGTNSWGTFLNAHPEEFERGGTIRCGFVDPPELLNPLYSSAYEEWQILDKIYDTLIKYDVTDFDVIPWMAESYTNGSWNFGGTNATKITFKLQHNILWHDNQPLTSADVAFTIQYNKDADSPPQYSSNYGAFWYEMVKRIDHVDTPDPYTVEVYFTEQNDYAVYQVGALPVIPKHIWENYPPQRPFDPEALDGLIGTGPFRCYRDNVIGRIDISAGRDYIHLSANPTYFRKLVQLDLATEVGGNIVPGHNGIVDIDDFGQVIGHYGCYKPWTHTTWDPVCDVDKDYIINIDDIMETGVRYGQTGCVDGYPPYYK